MVVKMFIRLLNRTFIFVIAIYLSSCAVGLKIDYDKKQKLLSTGVLRWKEEIKLIKGERNLRECSMLQSTKFKEGEYAYLKFLIFVKSQGANVATINSLKNETIFSKMEIETTPFFVQ